MNIFYIGPYRQNDFEGLASRNIIKSIAQKHDIFIRPIYYSGTDLVSQLDNDMNKYEDSDLKKYDCLIQHVKPIDCLHTQQFHKNILIPIIEDYDFIDAFIDFTIDKVLLDNDSLVSDTYSKKSEHFDYDVYIEHPKQIFDIGPLAALKKFYFVGEYKFNKDIILSVIRSFIYLRNNINTEYALVLFIINISQGDINIIQNYINETYKGVGAVHTINKIVLIPIGMNADQIVAAHASADICLDFNNQPRNQINKRIAHSLNKSIIDKPESKNESLYLNDTTYQKMQTVLTDQQVKDALLNFIIDSQLSPKHPKTKHYPHISEVI